MHTTEYKGFTIARNAAVLFPEGKNVRFYVTDGTDWHVVPGFRPDGYPTLNHAKGAITNYIKAYVPPADHEALEEQADNEFWDDVAAMAEADEEADTSVPVRQSRNKREGRYMMKRHGRHVRRTLVKHWLYAENPKLSRKQRKAVKLADFGF